MTAADSQYEVSFRPNWGDDGPIGHVVVRRLDDRAVVAEAPVLDQYEAERLLAQAEHDLRGSAADFELTWRIDGEARADPGPPFSLAPPRSSTSSNRIVAVRCPPLKQGCGLIRVPTACSPQTSHGLAVCCIR
jgi:hypothetical protein